MRLFPKHTQGENCEGCNERLKDAHPLIQSFFDQSKAVHNDLHCSWVYRDKSSQDEAYANGASRLKYPQSKHNKLPAEAIDVFQINDRGTAVFSKAFCVQLKTESENLGFDFRWGGDFKILGDFGHFEIK